MNTFYMETFTRKLTRLLVPIFILFAFQDMMQAEGSKQLSPTASDSVFLVTNDVAFGDFASYDGPAFSKLRIKIMDHTNENLYIGLSKRVNLNGNQTTQPYYFRIVDSIGNIVKAAEVVNPIGVGAAADQENASTWALASAGPDILGGGGYSTANPKWVFDPTYNGVFSIEFSQLPDMDDDDEAVNILWFDLTVVSDPTGTPAEEPGRVWANLWSLRTPQIPGPQTYPDCQWNREFRGTFFSYTMDGFVSRVNFDGSGFQGLNFNVAFGEHGPGQTGDIILDRQSVPGANATAFAADHMAFLQEPDPACFPSPADACGTAEIVRIECLNNDSFCIFVTTTLPGQVELILEFGTPNNVYDADSNDVILAEVFTTAPDTICIPWDGLKGDGSAIDPGSPIPLLLRYTQGVQHYAAYDVEFLKNGFCVETIRPVCPGAATNLLYWDDTELPDLLNTPIIDNDPGTGQPLLQLNGDTCQQNNTRTWTNFASSNGTCTGGTVFGYGEQNTLNTWWFAAVEVQAPTVFPLLMVDIEGDSIICSGDSTQFFALANPDTVSSYTYSWTGPGMFTSDADSTGFISEPGVYCVTVIDTMTVCTTTVCRTLIVNPAPQASVDFTCVAPNSPNGNIDLTISGGFPPYTIEWSTGDMIEDLMNVSPGVYDVTVTDDNGCTAFNSVTVEGCCVLDINCPPADGGIFACVDDVPAGMLADITINDFCLSVDVTVTDSDNGATGCAADPLVIAREYVLSDGVGNITTCIQTITVIDDVNPAVDGSTCPGDTAVLCTTPTDVLTLGSPQYTDNCSASGQIVITERSDSTGFDGSCVARALGTITRTFFGEDACGNIDSTCIQVITVIDTVGPVITACAPDIAVECTESTDPAATGVASATDACDPAPALTSDDVTSAGACPQEYGIVRTWTATDVCGNTTTCVQNISVEDNTVPVITDCPGDLDIECTESTDPASTGIPTATDACDPAPSTRFVDATVEGGCPQEYTIERTWTAFDGCGNESDCLQTINVNDNTAPSIVCPDNVTIECSDSIDPASTGIPTATDACDPAPVVDYQDITTSGACPQEYTIQRNWLATDGCGNNTACSQLISVADSNAPLIACPADVSIECTETPDPAVTGMASATDACDPAPAFSFADITVTGQCAQETIITRTWTATDACGNGSTCTQVITSEDTTPPVITACATDLTVECTDSTDPADTGMASATDACDPAPVLTFADVTVAGDCPQAYSIERTWTATDACGNTTDCLQVIDVEDSISPTITACAPDITIECTDSTDPADTGMASATDACDPATALTFADVTIAGGCPQEYSIERTWTATDACGNATDCLQVIEVEDTTAPTITACAADITIECTDSTDPADTGMASATDACDPAPALAFADITVAGECPQEYSIERTWTATDACGNATDCLQLITIQDNTGPDFTCAPDITIECTDSTEPANTGMASATDACDPSPVLAFSDVTMEGLCPQDFVVERTWTAADACGNESTCLQVIDARDRTAPVITACPADVSIECTASFDPNSTGTASATDACDPAPVVTFADVTIAGGCTQEYTIERIWTATDACGNTATCMQEITVEDNTPPVAVCRDVTLDFDVSPQITLDPDLVDDGSTDNCGAVNFELTQEVFECTDFVDVTTILTVMTILDECGNSTTCEFNVTGLGGGAVSIECPDDIVIYLGEGECGRIVDYEIETTEVCGGGDPVVEQTDQTGLTSGDFFPIGTTAQSYIAFDPIGIDTASCAFTITLIELDVPFNATCNDTVHVSLDPDCEALITPEVILEGENFGCGNDLIIEIESIGLDTGSLLVSDPVKDTYLSASVLDPDSGLSCWGTIIFEDKIPPTIECPCADYVAIDQEAYTLLGTYDGHTYYVSTGTFSWQEAFAAAGATSGHMLSIGSAGENQFIVNAFEGNDFRVWIGLTDNEAYGGMEAGSDPVNGWVWTDGSALDYTNWSGGEPNDGGNGEDYVEMFGNGQWNDNGNATFIQPFILEVDGICEYECTDDLTELPGPIAMDACDVVSVVSVEESESGDECDALIRTRTWVVQDGSGNTASCTQTFIIHPLSIDSLEFPDDYLGECGGSISPEVTGQPTVNGFPIDESLCNIFVSYWDKPLNDCGGGVKILRKWTVLDWCTQEVVNFDQVVKLTDNEGPVLTCPDDFEVGTDFWYCYATVSVPAPTAFDACGTDFTLQLESADGIVNQVGNNYTISELGLGDHVVTWIATDDCGNSNSCSFTVTVVDQVPPVPSCDEHTIVSLTNDGPKGLTLVDASVFDDGSYDHCGPVTFRARRMDSCIDFDWTTNGAGIDDIPNGTVNSRDRGTVHRPKVPFGCCDVPPLTGSLRSPIMVELEVTDAAGNVNYCMVEVEVQDKLSPYLECPPDIQVSCDFWFDSDVMQGFFMPLQADPLAEVFGTVIDAYDVDGDEGARKPVIINDPGNNTKPQPYQWGIDGWADDNCDVILDVRVKIIDDCSGAEFPSTAPDNAVRYIERTFRARDKQGNVTVCPQVIWVIDYKPFFITDKACNNPNPNDGVIWPCDELYETCPDSIPVNEPVIFDDNCSLIGVTYQDTRFDFVDDACYKILREWKVIDWCQYDADTGEGLWSYTQVIKVIDQDGPAFLDCPTAPVVLCAEDEEISIPANNQVFQGEDTGTSCSVHVRIGHIVEEFCSETVTYDVKVYPFDGLEFIQVQPKQTVQVREGAAELILDTKTAPQQLIRQNGLPYNSPFCGDFHRVLWTVEDGCGNTSTCSYLLRLEDCKQPTPVCINGLSTVVMPSNGSVTIWAKEFDASSIDDCTSSGNLLFSFNGDSYQPSMEYNCDNVPAFDVELSVQIWVADEGFDRNCNGQIEWGERNKDFCTTTIVITDNDDVCGGSGSVLEGEIFTHDSVEPVGGAKVNLSGPGGYEREFITDGTGGFMFQNLPVDETYTVAPVRNDNHLNGVSTLDLVRIQKHLLGIEPFESPYQFIAADANNSASVSALDLVEIRKLILGVYTEFPHNFSWRFVPEGYSFADPMAPWPFDESVTIEEMSMHMPGNDFMGVKVGDLNQTVVANAQAVVTRGAHREYFIPCEVAGEVRVGEPVAMTFTLPGEMIGMQWTLHLDGLSFSRMESISLDEDHLAVHDHALSMSYHRVAPGDALSFTLHFIAERSGKPEDMIRVTSEITKTEGYLVDGDGAGETEIVDLGIAFNALEAGSNAQYALFQNEPNPFSNATVIGFQIPERMDVRITVFDAVGKQVRVIEGQFAGGYSQVWLDKRDLPGSGVFYYTLMAGDFTATKKLILTD